MIRVFIDGKEGTTGLKIFERFAKSKDIEILTLEDNERKNIDRRLACVKKADVTFLCLPDEAAIEISELAPEHCRIIDTSTAHRTNSEWVYGMPELSSKQRNLIKEADRVAAAGCHATGFILSVRPLIENNIIPKSHLFSCISITGYSGGGKKMIAEYESKNITTNTYATLQTHKHLPEMVKMTGIENAPIFIPIVGNYFSGMHVMVPVDIQNDKKTIKELTEIYQEKYKNDIMITVEDANAMGLQRVYADTMSGSDKLKIWVSGNDERCVVNTLYDNLGKGASGAAIQCMNIMLGLEEEI